MDKRTKSLLSLNAAALESQARMPAWWRWSGQAPIAELQMLSRHGNIEGRGRTIPCPHTVSTFGIHFYMLHFRKVSLRRLNFVATGSRFQFQNSLPVGIASRFQKRTRTSLITCKQAGQDVDSKIRLGLDEWIKKNDEMVRVAPALIGASSFLLVLLNRTLSGIAPVADASSAQSRADVIAVVLSATLVLTGLVWISVKPQKLIPVELDGISCLRLEDSLPASAAAEVMWAWEALKNVSCCQGLVIVYKGCCVLQAGLASVVQGEPKIVDSSTLVKGSLCEAAWRSGKQSYLANLPLYPGRFELSFFPPNTQAVILQPLGDDGIMIVAGDTVRGFGATDQAWILSIGEKLDATLGKFSFTTRGVG